MVGQTLKSYVGQVSNEGQVEAAKSDDSIMSIVGRQSIQFWLVDYLRLLVTSRSKAWLN
jgi:hypothetical protein